MAASILLVSISDLATSASCSCVSPGARMSRSGRTEEAGSSHAPKRSYAFACRMVTAVRRRCPPDGNVCVPETWISGSTSRAGPGPITK